MRPAADAQLELDFKEIWYSPPVKFDSILRRAVQKARRISALETPRSSAGAGHDSVYMSRVTPTSNDLRALQGRHQPQRESRRQAR
jgi:N-carbamoyl-L-amino-acid hydrolase